MRAKSSPGLPSILVCFLLSMHAARPALARQSAELEREVLGEHELAITDLAFVNKGKAIVTSAESGELKLWNARTGKLLGKHRWHEAVSHLEICNDGKAIVFVSKSTLGQVDTKKAKFKGSAALGTPLRSITWVPRWRWIFLGSDGGLFKRLPSDGITSEPDSYGTGADGLIAMACDPTGTTVAAGTEAGVVHLVDPNQLELFAELAGHTAAISSLDFDDAGGLLVSGSLDGTLRLWDFAERKDLALLADHGKPVRSVTFAPGGRVFASGDDAGTILIWDTRAQKVLASAATDDAHPIVALDFDEKGKRLASASGSSVVVWDVGGLKPAK